MQQNPIQNGRKRQTGFSSHASIAASFTSQTGSRYAEFQAVHSHSPTTYPFFRRKNRAQSTTKGLRHVATNQ
jgi:hypothetical protein